MKKLTGLAACQGHVVGVIACLPDKAVHTLPSYTITKQAVQEEKERFHAALKAAQTQTADILARLEQSGTAASSPEKTILETHAMMLSDEVFIQSVDAELEHSLYNIEQVLQKKIDETVHLMNSYGDPFFAARAVDMHDAFAPVFSYLLKKQEKGLSRFSRVPEHAIIAARSINPSEALELKKLQPAGILMEEGSVTSHIAIMVRAWNIPLITGISGLMTKVANGMTVILDCTHNEVLLEPDEKTKTQFKSTATPSALTHNEEKEFAKIFTKDGEPVYLTANIAFSEEADAPLVQHAAGIGLFRSEFLFLSDTAMPDEEKQYREYRAVLEAMHGKPVVIRTFDAGADKMVEEQTALSEKNALLGWRAIRYCLDRPELFKTQLRAIMRAACHGNAHIMLPMISSVDEISAVKTLLTQAMQECEHKKLPYKKDIPLGIMVEVPSTAIAADIYAPLVDFFSIGTNDLVQYTMAADRQNNTVASLNDYFQPAVLRLIAHTISAGTFLHNQRTAFVSMCGEMASQEEAAPLLLGMGLRHFSMSAHRLPIIKKRIESLSAAETQNFFSRIGTLRSATEIRTAVREAFPYD